MLPRLAVAVALVGAAAFPALAQPDPVCVQPHSHMYACHDRNHPRCVVYGSLGEEANYHLGQECPWPWG